MVHAISPERHRTEKSAKRVSLAPVPQATPSPVIWSHVPLVPQVVLVGQRDGLPVAIIDQVGNMGFRVGLCSGKSIGIFRTLDEGKRAVAAELGVAADS